MFSDTVELFPVASATDFFTDLHHILRIMSVGNTRSACHHRLRLLEEVDINILFLYLSFVC